MIEAITLEEREQATLLSNVCLRLLTLDALWTMGLAAPSPSDHDRERTATFGREMVVGLTSVESQAKIVEYFASAFQEVSKDYPQYLDRLDGGKRVDADGMISQVESALQYLQANAESEIAELESKARDHLTGGLPPGDIRAATRKALLLVGGFLLVAIGAVGAVLAAQGGLPSEVATTIAAGPAALGLAMWNTGLKMIEGSDATL
ncbi:hypothetical protein ACQ86F_25415 [Streptomyces venezuelae ATCC 10712]